VQGLFLIFNLVFGYNQIERGKIWYFNKYKYYFKKNDCRVRVGYPRTIRAAH
jgi:hypothetical protein